jgi:hypothetical protein
LVGGYSLRSDTAKTLAGTRPRLVGAHFVDNAPRPTARDALSSDRELGPAELGPAELGPAELRPTERER